MLRARAGSAVDRAVNQEILGLANHSMVAGNQVLELMCGAVSGWHRHVWGSFFGSWKCLRQLPIGGRGYVLAQLVVTVVCPRTDVYQTVESWELMALEGEFHNDTPWHQCLPGRMSTPKLLPPMYVSLRMNSSCLLYLWGLPDQQLGLTQGLFRGLLFPWILEHVSCVYIC